MTIDPITTPKSISTEEIYEFYKYAMELKKLDLLIFKLIIITLKNNPEANIDEIIDECIKDTEKQYREIGSDVKKLYKRNNLVYNASNNPFI